MKNAYLIVTDLHCDTEKANRLNYFGECLGAIQSVMTIAAKYREQGCSVRLIFLGDVFDAGLSNNIRIEYGNSWVQRGGVGKEGEALWP